MRFVFAAALALLLVAPTHAGGRSSTIAVGLTVTGNLASSLAGTWQSRTVSPGAIYHFAVTNGSGAFYQRVSLPLRAGNCDLRLSGVIYSLERAGSGYEMHYGVRSADVVSSSTDPEACEDVAAAYLSDSRSPHSLTLSPTGKDRLLDPATGAAYIRTR
ncbi:MAG: hypothetical protein EOP22_14260 [Hyphomicrobiales bacterium]|nr:MAG: hypothetical protein EOP22_14260 [Hyphomicrobiales bacterium]